jgi:hypothetical protein
MQRGKILVLEGGVVKSYDSAGRNPQIVNTTVNEGDFRTFAEQLARQHNCSLVPPAKRLVPETATAAYQFQR